MNIKLLALTFFCGLTLALNAQEAVKTQLPPNPTVKLLKANGISTNKWLTYPNPVKKTIAKSFKTLPAVEVYTNQGQRIKYTDHGGQVNKSFFEPRQTIVSVTAEPDLESGALLGRMGTATLLDGSPMTMDVLSNVEKYYVLVFWKKSTGKNGLKILMDWQIYATLHPELGVIYFSLD